MKMVAVGFVLAVPVTWYIMREWLSAYTERIAIGWLTFAAAGLTAAAIALLDRLLAELPGRQRQSGRLGEKIMGKELSDSLGQ